MDPIRWNTGQRKSCYCGAQERPRPAHVEIRFSHWGVRDQPVVGDDPGVIVIFARDFSSQRSLVKVDYPDSRSVPRQITRMLAHSVSLTIMGSVDVESRHLGML